MLARDLKLSDDQLAGQGKLVIYTRELKPQKDTSEMDNEK